MIILDYLFFYLTYWFNKNSSNLKWSTPTERSSYVIGIATTTFLVSLAEVLAFTVYKNSKFPIPDYAFVGVGLIIMYFYDYIYIKKDRYNSIRLNNKFDSEDYKKGVIISWVIVVICIFLPALIFMYFVPFGDKRSISVH